MLSKHFCRHNIVSKKEYLRGSSGHLDISKNTKLRIIVDSNYPKQSTYPLPEYNKESDFIQMNKKIF